MSIGVYIRWFFVILTFNKFNILKPRIGQVTDVKIHHNTTIQDGTNFCTFKLIGKQYCTYKISGVNYFRYSFTKVYKYFMWNVQLGMAQNKYMLKNNFRWLKK